MIYSVSVLEHQLMGSLAPQLLERDNMILLSIPKEKEKESKLCDCLVLKGNNNHVFGTLIKDVDVGLCKLYEKPVTIKNYEFRNISES